MPLTPAGIQINNDVEEDPLRASIEWLWHALLGANPEWSQGRLSISNKELSFKWLDDLQLPLAVACSHVGRLHVTLPSAVRAVARSGNAAAAADAAAGSQCDSDDSCWFEVQVADVFAILKPVHPDDLEVDSHAILEKARRTKRENLQALSKAFILPEQAAKKPAASGLHGLLAHFQRKSVGHLLRHASIDIQNVHLRYEDPVTSPRFVFSGGLLLKHLVVSNAPVPLPRDNGSQTFRKRAVACLSMYWQSYDPEMFSNKIDWRTSMARQQDTRISDSGQISPHAHQVLPATDIKASFCSPCPKTGATISVEITVPKFVPCLSQAMTGDLVLLAQLHNHWKAWLQNSLSACARFRQLAPQHRPTSHPKAWWHHAVSFTQKLRRLREATRYWLTPDVQWQVRFHRAYLDLVEQEMLEMKAAADENRQVFLPPELDQALDRIEGALPEGLLALWRRQAAGHPSVLEGDLKLLGIRRRAFASAGEGQSSVEMDVTVASERSAAGKALSSPQSSPGPSLELAVLVEAQRVGISFREVPVLHTLHRVPFEIVSHRATTSNYQSQECPATHQVLGKPLRNISRSTGRFPWNAQRTVPEAWAASSSTWACLGTGAPANGQGRRPPKVRLDIKELEVTLQELRFQSKQTLGKAGMSSSTTSFSVQRVHAGRPGDMAKVTPVRLDYESSTPLVSSHWMGEPQHALQATLHTGTQDHPSRLQVELGQFKLSVTPENVEDVIFFSQELLPQRSGKEAYYMSFTKCTALFPEASRVADSSSAKRSFRHLEVSIHLSRLLICGIGGFNNRAVLSAEVIQGHASWKPKSDNAASQKAMPDEIQLRDKGKASPHPWLLRTKFVFVLSTSSRKAASYETDFLGEGVGAYATSCVDGLMLSKVSECEIETAVTWHAHATSGNSAAIDGAEPASDFEVNIPHWKMYFEETYTMTTISQVLGSLVVRLPQRLPRCVLSSRMKLWYPPRMTSMHQRSSMTKEGPGSSSEDEDRYDEARGHWSCDLWGELLEDGSMEIYSHPFEFLPLYTLRIQEMRGGLKKQVTPVRRAQSRLTKEARELEVLVAVPDVAAASESGGNPPMSARKGALSAWVYIQCLDSHGDHWVWSWEAQVRSLRMGASSHMAQECGGPYSDAVSPRRVLVCPAPWNFRLNILHVEAKVHTCFNAPVHASCKSFAAELTGSNWHLRCSAEDVCVEDQGYSEFDQRRFLISALPDGFGSSTDEDKFFILSMSLAYGGCLQLAPSHIAVNPVHVRRLMHAFGMFCELWNTLSLSPILESGLSCCTGWISSAIRCMQSGNLRLSQAYIKAVQNTSKPPDEQRFVFEVAAASLEVMCLQSFTALQVASCRLEGLSVEVACRPQCEFALECLSASLDTLLLSGITGSKIIKAQPSEVPAPTGVGSVDHQDQATRLVLQYDAGKLSLDYRRKVCEHAAVPFFKAACRRRFQGKDPSAWCLSAASLSPWRVTYYYTDCCRLAEFAADVANACTWTSPRVSTPSQGRLWPFALWTVPQTPHSRATRAEFESTGIDNVEAVIDLHLPSIFVPSSRVSEDSLPESLAEPWIEVALGHLHISSSLGELKQAEEKTAAAAAAVAASTAPPAEPAAAPACAEPAAAPASEELASATEETISPDAQTVSVIDVKWSGFLGITGKTRNLIRCVSPLDVEAPDLLDDSPPEFSSVQSQGCDMALHANVEPQTTFEKTHRRLSVAIASDGLNLSVPCSVLQVFFSNVALHEQVCKAPSIPPRNPPASWLSRFQRMVVSKASAMNYMQVIGSAEISECLIEITDIEDHACLRAKLLGLHQNLCFHGDSGLLEAFDFRVETLRLESLRSADWCSVFFLQRHRGQLFDVQATFDKTERESEATETSVDDGAKMVVHAREVRVIAGSPRLHLDPILVAYCQYVTCLTKGVAAESASASRNAESLQSAMLAQRRAEAMAAAYHQNLEEFTLPPDIGLAGMTHNLSGAHKSLWQPSGAAPASCAVHSALTVHTMSFECGIFFVEFPCHTSTSLFHLALRPVVTFKRETGFGEQDLSFKLALSECRLARSDSKGTHCIVSPFKMYVNLQYARLRAAVDAPAWQPLFSQVARAVLDLDDITINLAWQDVLSLLELHYFLEPPLEVFDALFKDLESYSGLHASWPLQRKNDPAARAMFSTRSDARVFTESSSCSFLGSLHACLEAFTETCASFGGLKCIFHDSYGLAGRLSVMPFGVQAGLFEANGSLPADVGQAQTCSCRTKISWELELWHSWTGVWEPVLEPCDIIVIFSVSAGHEILTFHCPSLQMCVKGQHFREGRRRCSSAQAELNLAEKQWAEKRRAIWKCPAGTVFGIASLQWGSPASADDHDDHIPEENESSGHSMSSIEGSLLRLRNDTGCTFAIALLLEEFGLQASQNGNVIFIQDGEELEIGCVGKISNAHLCLHSGDSKISNATIEDIHMRCSAPVMRAFPTGWSDTLLWQEVSADAAGVRCRFHSPICVANQTPLAVDVKYEDGVEPCTIQPCDSRGLHLAHVHNVKELRLRFGTVDSSEWSQPIALETTFGSGYVQKCGTSWEVVVEITAGGKGPGTKIHSSCEQTTVVLSPRCLIYNTLPIPLQVHLASSSGSDGTSLPSPKFTVGPEQHVATMTVPAGGDELWMAIAQEGQSVWSKVKPVQLRSVQRSSTVLSIESDAGDSHNASILQVEVRSVINIRGRYLGPQVCLGIFANHLLVSHCPFSLRVSARVDEHLRWISPLNVAHKESLQLWALPRLSFRLHGDPATGPVVATNTEDIPETGAIPARIGQFDVAVSRSHLAVSASVGISSLYLVVVPRFWIFSHLDFDVEARQVDQDAGLVDLAALISIKAQSGAVMHLPRQASVPSLVLRRRGVSSSTAWSGSINICKEQRCTLALPDDTVIPTGILLVEVVQQPTGQLAIHLSLAEAPDHHIENHTSMQLQLHQFGRESLGPCTVEPMTVLLWSWPDPAAAQDFTRGRPGPLRIKCDRWAATEWMSVNPHELGACSSRHSGVELTAHVRREGGICIVAITAFHRVREDLRVPIPPLFGRSQHRRHLRVSCSDVSVSIVGDEAELFRLTFTGVVAGEDVLTSSQTMMLSVATLKLDHLAPGAGMPAVIRTALPKRGLFFTVGCSWNLGLRSPSGLAPAPLLEASFLGERQGHSVDCLDVHISELWIAAHIRSLVTSMLALKEVVHSEVPPEKNVHFAESMFAPPWHPPQHVVIRELRLSPVALQLQVSMLNFDIGSLDHLGQQFEAARRMFRLLSVRDLHENRICLREFVADEVTGSVRSVWELLKTHYGYAICHQALCTMCAGGGGADMSGGSEGRRIMRHLSESLEHFFRAPLSPTGPSQPSRQADLCADAAQKPVLQVMGSMGRGTVSLLSHTAQGARHSVAHVSRFFGRSIALMSLDSEFEAEIADPQFQQTSNFVHGFDPQQRPLNSLISQVGCWRSPLMSHQDSLLGCSSNAHVCGEQVVPQGTPAFGGRGYASFMDSPQNANWQHFASWFKPLASFLGLDSSPSDSTSEVLQQDAEDETWESFPDFSVPPPPRLLVGPHRLITRHSRNNAQLRRVLDQLTDEAGRSICYEDHCAALELDCINLLTDVELMVIRCSGVVSVERRWALECVTPMSVRADGSLVRFSAELGVSGALEISIGSGEVRCINVTAAEHFAHSIHRMATEAQFRRVPYTLGAQHDGQSDKTIVSL